MVNHQKVNHLARVIWKLGFLRGSIPLLLLWPMICLALSALLWGVTLAKLDADKRALEKNAMKDASTLSRGYAQQLTRAIEQVDQITMLVKQDWERSHGTLKLEGLLRKGLFPVSRLVYVTIIDRNGIPITSTLPLRQQRTLADRDYFLFQKNDKSNSVFIGKPVIGRLSGRTVILFSRRLDAPDGAFDGVVAVSVEPTYFSSFYDGSSLGKAGLLAMVGTDGALRMARTGDVTLAPPPPALHTIPAFGHGEGAVFLAGGSWFADHQARFVGWSTLKSYPFVAMVGLSEDEVLAPHRETWTAYRHSAFVGIIFLFVFALVATLLSARLAWIKSQAEKAREAYGIATEGGNEAFYMCRALRDKRGATVDVEVVDCNERGAALYGVSKAQLLGTRLSTFYSGSYFEKLLNTFRGAMESGFHEDEYQIPPDSLIKMDWMHRRFVRAGTGLAVTVRDISEAKVHELELLRLANKDELTGLPNRHWFVGFLPAALERAKSADTMLGLLFIDLDGFKDVNDTLGHEAGDELLQAASLRLKSILRPNDSIVRLGGDEFTVIVERVVHESEAVRVAERIAEVLKQPFQLSRGRRTVGASIGIGLFPRDGEDGETLLKNADIAMYSAKTTGKGHYCVCEPRLRENFEDRLDTEQVLLQALEQDQFVLFYQPRVCAVTGKLCGMEALVRWMHPERGLVPPLEFIPLAETTGLILKLGELVMEKACAQLARWKEQKLPLVPVSINVSAHQFNHGDLKNLLAACLARHAIGAELVEIEITDAAMMGEQTETIAELSAIRALGIKLLVDDFGTGYSSLSQLHRLDIDVLKVDRAFTAELGKTSRGETFFKAIIPMAHGLGIKVVAEGVETEEQLRVLQSLSCDEIRGYFISRPVPASDMPALMQKRFLLPTAVPLRQAS